MSVVDPPRNSSRISGRPPSRALERAFRGLCLFAALLPVLVLAVLLFDVVRTGLGRIDVQFLTSFPSRRPSSSRRGSSAT